MLFWGLSPARDQAVDEQDPEAVVPAVQIGAEVEADVEVVAVVTVVAAD